MDLCGVGSGELAKLDMKVYIYNWFEHFTHTSLCPVRPQQPFILRIEELEMPRDPPRYDTSRKTKQTICSAPFSHVLLLDSGPS